MGNAVWEFRRRAAGLLLSAGAMAGCAPPTVVYRPVTDAVAARQGEPLELRLATGERYIITGARVQHDTLYAVRATDERAPELRVVVPVQQIVSLTETERRLNPLGAGAAGLAVGLVGGALLLVLVALGLSGT